MNKIYKLLGGKFIPMKGSQGGPALLPANCSVSLQHMDKLLKELREISNFWTNEGKSTYKIFGDSALVELHYQKIIPKSKRITRFFYWKKNPDNFVVGSRFGNKSNKIYHIFTYSLSIENINNTISLLQKAISFFRNQVLSSINNDVLLRKGIDKKYIAMAVDCYFIDRINVNFEKKEIADESVISLYKVNNKNLDILRKIGLPDIKISNFVDYDEQTVILLKKEQIEYLNEKVPYLIAMSAKNKQKIVIDKICTTTIKNVRLGIKAPTNEPIIGVIDTLFNTSVYFNKWVEYHDMVNPDIPRNIVDDYIHGTDVSSIIVDGPNLNADLQDNCGNFRVRHFGIMSGKMLSSFIILKKIIEIVRMNRDIKVWNLCLGSQYEINKNFVSFISAELDKLQNKYDDIIFVIAGTNDNDNTLKKYIGEPADSINSLVVNSVDDKGKRSNFSRKGPVLSFFYKPDLSYYGENIKAFNGYNENFDIVSGTSFSAPWITRKLAYLIHQIGLTREAAKALVIDSAAGWNRLDADKFLGYGVVPKKIDDLLKTNKDEIKFIISSKTLSYKTFVRHIPVPISNEKFPYRARATMCYFPGCRRDQGVDYTDTELDIRFGRVQKSKSGFGIKSIDNNVQLDEMVTEADARKYYRKWDNVKHISDGQGKKRAKNLLNGITDWGIQVTSIQRSNAWNRPETKFSVIVTLKALDGINRIDEFINNCRLNSWIVEEIDIENKNKLYNDLESELNLN